MSHKTFVERYNDRFMLPSQSTVRPRNDERELLRSAYEGRDDHGVGGMEEINSKSNHLIFNKSFSTNPRVSSNATGNCNVLA